MFEIRIDDRQLKQLERTLAGIPRALPRVMSRALNRTATEARTKASRILSKRLGLKVGDIRKRILLSKATYSRWRSAHNVIKQRLPIPMRTARQTGRGVFYRDYETRDKILVRHAFIAQMPSSHKGIFRRRWPESQWSKGRDEAGHLRKGRLPIDEWQGHLFSNIYSKYRDENGPQLKLEYESILAKNIHDQVRLILARRAG